MPSEDWKRATRELVDASSEPLGRRAKQCERPERLFHFTDVAGLIGILQNSSLRASLAPSLNDPSEIAHGLACAREQIEGYVGSVDKDFVRSIGRLLDLSNVPAAYRMELRAYVISFCARDDNALHWLHYGRSGAGVAIVFDGSALERAPFDLVKVVYTAAEQHALIESVIEATASCLSRNVSKFRGAEGDALVEVAANIAAARLRFIPPLMKHPGFETEEEWRLVTHDVGGQRVDGESLVTLPMGYRAVADRVVPYQELVFERLPATEIVLGWSAAMRLDDEGLGELMQNTSGKLKVSRSSIPVRP